MKAILCSVLFVIAFVSLAVAQGTYTQIDYLGAVDGTFATDIDGLGNIIGFYSSLTPVFHGFRLSAGTYATIDDPQGTSTELFGTNDAGMEFVGVSSSRGFTYNSQSGAFTTVSYPGATYTAPYAVNNSGVVAGVAVTASPADIGFERAGSIYRSIVPPGGTDTAVRGVANSGELAGESGPGFGNFIFSHGQYRTIASSLFDATVYGINPQGTALVGTYYTSSGLLVGFLYQNGTLTTLQFPGATQTFACGINSAGQVVGSFEDSLGTHGFTWTPSADAANK